MHWVISLTSCAFCEKFVSFIQCENVMSCNLFITSCCNDCNWKRKTRLCRTILPCIVCMTVCTQYMRSAARFIFLRNAIYLFSINLFKCTNAMHKNTLTSVDVGSFIGFLKITKKSQKLLYEKLSSYIIVGIIQTVISRNFLRAGAVL